MDDAATNPTLGYSVCPHDCPSTCALEVEVLGPDRIGACYVEAWTEATAGCAELVRQEE